jgi:hypothetical protein
LEGNYLDKKDLWKRIFSAIAFAVISTFYTTLQTFPGQLVFGRDMIFNIFYTAKWKYIEQ